MEFARVKSMYCVGTVGLPVSVERNVDEWWCRQFVTGGQFMEEVERCMMQTMLQELTRSVGFDTWYESRHTMRMRYTEQVQKQTYCRRYVRNSLMIVVNAKAKMVLPVMKEEWRWQMKKIEG